MARGDGSIINLGNGKWRVAVSYTDPITNEPDRAFERVTGSYKDAYKKREELKKKYQDMSKKARGTTLECYLTDWNEGRYEDGAIRYSTYSHYRNSINTWIAPYIGNIAIADLTPQIIRKWIKNLKEKQEHSTKNKPSDLTIKQAFKTLKTALKEAVYQLIIPANPADRVRTPKAELAKRGYLEPDEIARMVNVLDSMELSGFTMAVLLGISTGARRSEILGLQWQDVVQWKDRKGTHATLHIQRTLVQVDRGKKGNNEGKQHAKEWGKPKTAAGYRKITLDGYTLNKLTEWKGQQAKQLAELGLNQASETPICCSLYGAKFNGVPKFAGLTLDPSKFTTVFHEFCKEYGFYSTTGKLLCFHELRHAQATILLSEGVPDVIVCGHMGHSSPSVTRDLYSHFMPVLDQQCANVMGNVIRNGLHARSRKQEKIIAVKTA